MNLKNYRQTIFVLCILATVLFLPSSFVSSQQGCGECPNPLAELKNLETGDVSSVMDEIQKMDREFYGWNELLHKKGIADPDVLDRGTEFLEGVKKMNPCADIYYTYEVYDGHEWQKKRVGKKQGKAKYIIRSYFDMKKAAEGEKALVKRVEYKTTELEVPRKRLYRYDGTTVVELTDYYDVEEISNQLAVVPKKGTIEIRHELIALKNNQIYDTGGMKTDWFPELPEDVGYFNADGETLTVDGRTYTGSEGMITGSFATGSIAGSQIEFNKGDIGVTIRKKETPSSCSMDVDEISFYPPDYRIKIQNIRNLFGERMPNNVRIALKVEKGEIKNGEELDGWKVFDTVGGEIPIEIFYEVPECSKAKSDTLEIAAVCDWHDGEPSVGETRIIKNVHIPQCLVRSALLTKKRHKAFKKYSEVTPGGGVLLKDEEESENHYEVTVAMTFEDKPFMILPGGDNLLIYGYRLKSCEVASQNIYYKEKSHKLEKIRVHFREWHSDDYIRGTVKEIKPIVESSTRKALELTVDKRTNKVVRVGMFPSFDAWVVKRGKSEYQYRDSIGGYKDRVDDIDDEGWQSVGPNLDEEFTDDGKHLIRGYKEKVEKGEFMTDSLTIEWKIFRY